MNNAILQTRMERLVILLLPTVMRKPGIIAIVCAITKPIAALYTALVRWRQNTIEELKYNGQTCRLQYCLNSILDPMDRRIYIVDGTTGHGMPYWVYARGHSTYNDDLPLHRGAPGRHIILNSRESNAEKHYHFYVVVPDGVNCDSQRLKALVNTYKLPSKTWIQTTPENYAKRKLQ